MPAQKNTACLRYFQDGFERGTGPSSRPLRPRGASLLRFGWLFALGLTACAGKDFQNGQQGGSACTPGEMHCVCDELQQCVGDLLCVADRCVEIPSSFPGVSTTTEAEQTSDASGTKSLPEEPGSEASSSSSSSEDSASPESSSSSSPSGQDSSSDDASSDSTQGPDPDPDPEPSEQAACLDGVRNHRETDVDCGGPVCSPCALTKECKGGQDCQSEHCVQDRCVECEADLHCDDANDCTKNRCEANACVSSFEKEGSACDDLNPCTAKDVCDAKGLCAGVSTLVIDENFDNNNWRWRTQYANQEGDSRSMWKLGKARASNCGDFMGEDPAQDHTQNGINGVAGVVIGGCHEGAGQDKHWDCLWSKDFRVSHFEEPVVVSFWRHLHSPAQHAKHGVINRIVYREITDPNEIHDLERGYPGVIDDKNWSHELLPLPASVKTGIAVGFCYRKLPGAPAFAGWTLDDFKIRQRGCLMDQ